MLINVIDGVKFEWRHFRIPPITCCILSMTTFLICSQVIALPDLSTAPSATMMMFSLWPESLASDNFLHNFSGQLTTWNNKKKTD